MTFTTASRMEKGVFSPLRLHVQGVYVCLFMIEGGRSSSPFSQNVHLIFIPRTTCNITVKRYTLCASAEAQMNAARNI